MFGTVRTVAVLPDSKITSMSPDAGGVIDNVLTSPQMYRIPAFPVMVGVVPLTVTGASSISWILDCASSVYVPTALEDAD